MTKKEFCCLVSLFAVGLLVVTQTSDRRHSYTTESAEGATTCTVTATAAEPSAESPAEDDAQTSPAAPQPAVLKLNVVNETGKEAYIHWVIDGESVPYKKLAPNQSAALPSYEGQRWGALIKDRSKAPEFVMPATDTTWHLRPALFKLNLVNETGKVVYIYYLNKEDKPVFYQKLLANQSNGYQSHEGHRWLAAIAGRLETTTFVMPAKEATWLLPKISGASAAPATPKSSTIEKSPLTGLTSDQLGKVVAEYRAKDFKPVQIKGYAIGQESRFDIKFTEDAGSKWRIIWDKSTAEFEKANKEWISKGYRRTFKSTWNIEGETRHGAIWETKRLPTVQKTVRPG